MNCENKIFKESEVIKENSSPQFNKIVEEFKPVRDNPAINDNLKNGKKSQRIANGIKQVFFVAIAGTVVL